MWVGGWVGVYADSRASRKTVDSCSSKNVDCCCLRACERLRLRGHGLLFFYFSSDFAGTLLSTGSLATASGRGCRGRRRRRRRKWRRKDGMGVQGVARWLAPFAQKERYRKREIVRNDTPLRV